MKLFRKSKRLIILVMVVLISIPSTYITLATIKENSEPQISLSEQDKIIIAEISNKTGYSSEEILELKNEVKTWNEVLEILKIDDIDIGNLEQREELLLKADLGDKYIEELIKLGYSEEKIIDAKMIVERVIYQLEDIINEGNTLITPSIDNGTDNSIEELDRYKELYEVINTEKAIKLMLALESEFGTMESVFDEYLCAIQLEIDIEMYLKDIMSYEEEKLKKMAEYDSNKIITISKIEEKMLEIIQSNSVSTGELKDNYSQNENENLSTTSLETNIKPEDPLEDVMKEVNDIINDSFDPNY